MKTILKPLCASLLLAVTMSLRAEDSATPKKGSAEFERLKSLVGTWKGTTDMGQGPIDMTIQYRLLAAGTVLEERVFAGTPNEMVTMYYEKNGKVALTHYCVLGNQPGMVLKSADADSLRFDFDATCGIDATKESHMHALTIHFDSPNTITTSCKAIIEGKEAPDHATKLTRVKS